MRRWKTAMAATAMLALAGCTGGHHSTAATAKTTVIPQAQRKQVGQVQGTLLAGGQFALSADLGHVTVLNYFASWCGPCQNETPQFDSVYRARKASGIRFVGFDAKDPSKSASRAWVAAKQISFPVVYDETAKTAIQIGDIPIPALPVTVLIDKHGKIAGVYPQLMLPADLNPLLDTLTAEA